MLKHIHRGGRWKGGTNGSNCGGWCMETVEGGGACRASFIEIMAGDLHPSGFRLISIRLLM